jgi:CRP-like cAMP-binding protein/DNA-binding NarL/FixJ family response regulator
MKKVLFIENQSFDNKIIKETIVIGGYQLLLADNGRAGIRLAIEHKPDLIIANIELSLLDGLSVLHLLRKNEEFLLTPIIFVSEKNDSHEMRRIMTAGADDCIAKPFNETDLLYAIECRLTKAEDILKYSSHGNKEGDFINEKELLSNFLDGRNHHSYAKKQKIYSEGENPKYLYFIKKGKVKLKKSNSEGKDLIVELCGEGDFIGHTALIQNSSYRESAESIDYAELALIPRADFQELIKCNLMMANRFNQILALNLVQKNSHLVNMAYNSLRKKVAEALLLLKEKYDEDEQINFNISINREDLANIAGTAKESLIRTLSDFKSESLIDIKQDGSISILNVKALVSLAC